ncbi:hypothetical protein [Bradyrhizobium liaoningense]|uniref:hypothetical protein n=1 Tax=Bradyrhizobium liaoningense TaxID=43992 RepID=UPI001FE51739|nr:hypothetical protein [Bradyrhizobium liaoningense]
MGRTLHGVVVSGGRLIAIGLLAMATTAAAQSPGPGPINPPPAERPGTIIGGQPAGHLERCVDVQIGNESAFGCLNQKLRREVDKVNPSLNLPPVDARSPDVRVGNVNEAAVRQQYGSNYGRSAFPFRPPSVTNVVPRR